VSGRGSRDAAALDVTAAAVVAAPPAMAGEAAQRDAIT